MVENVLPVFLVLALGAAAGKLGLLRGGEAEGLNRLTAHLALPALLVLTIGTSSFSAGFSAGLTLVSTALVVAAAACALLCARLLRLPAQQRGVFSQAVFRGNLAYMAFPVIAATLGEGGLRRAAMTAAVLIPVMNFLAVVVLLYARGGKQGLGKLAVRVLTNPLVLGANLGLLLSALAWRPWAWLSGILKILADFALPAALLACGAQLDIRQVGRVRWPLVFIVAGKLLVLPGLAFVLLRGLGAAPLDLQVGTLLLASPTAVASYPVASELGGDKSLAGAAVLVTTALAFPAFVFWGLLCGLR
jgi:predicted permease